MRGLRSRSQPEHIHAAGEVQYTTTVHSAAREDSVIRSWKGIDPKVHPSAFVSEAAYVLGEVVMGENASVWPGTVIRGDSGKIVIGRNTSIQDCSLVHSDHAARIGDNVAIGHGVVCHAKEIGEYCLIGNNATINDGVELGEYCIVAANAAVLENTRIPPYSFVVGIPAQVKSRVTERHIELIKSTVAHYVERCKEYKELGLE